jgi:hypothetical protein
MCFVIARRLPRSTRAVNDDDNDDDNDNDDDDNDNDNDKDIVGASRDGRGGRDETARALVSATVALLWERTLAVQRTREPLAAWSLNDGDDDGEGAAGLSSRRDHPLRASTHLVVARLGRAGPGSHERGQWRRASCRSAMCAAREPPFARVSLVTVCERKDIDPAVAAELFVGGAADAAARRMSLPPQASALHLDGGSPRSALLVSDRAYWPATASTSPGCTSEPSVLGIELAATWAPGAPGATAAAVSGGGSGSSGSSGRSTDDDTVALGEIVASFHALSWLSLALDVTIRDTCAPIHVAALERLVAALE